jgi:hypothetical protein
MENMSSLDSCQPASEVIGERSQVKDLSMIRAFRWGLSCARANLPSIMPNLDTLHIIRSETCHTCCAGGQYTNAAKQIHPP